MEEAKIVVDASVVVKWFLEEEFSREALRIRDDYVMRKVSIAVPSLLEYEVLNALKYSGVYSRDELREAGVALNKYGFKVYELEGRFKELTVELAVEEGVTVYDASYVALARMLEAPLYTADEELIERFPAVAVHVKSYGT